MQRDSIDIGRAIKESRRTREITTIQVQRPQLHIANPLVHARPDHQISPQDLSGREPWGHKWIQLLGFFYSNTTRCTHTKASAELIIEIICSSFICILFVHYLSIHKISVVLLLFGSNPKVSVAPDYCTGSVLPWLGRAQAGNSSRHSVGRAWTQTSHGWRAKRPTLAATLLTDSDSEEPTVNGPGFAFSLSADRFQLDFSRFHLAAGSTLL